MNYWDNLMGSDEGAADYMISYGEGPGSKLRHYIGALINDGETVLDIGCGPGWNFDHFKEFGPRVIYQGQDYSKRFVKVANARAYRKYGQMPFAAGDCRDLHIPDKGVDVVILQDTLEHTNGYEKPLQEALRAASKRVVVTFWHLSDDDNPHINDDGDDGWGAWYDKREWEKYLDSLQLNWLHDELPREKGEGTKWDIYIIDRGQDGNL